VSTCCNKNYNGQSCEHQELKIAYEPAPVDKHGITKCENENCFCHHWPKMNRHERRKFQKTGDRE
jgi:hypothetical protein